MKCAAHGSDATAVCVHCGRALCATCARPTPANRLVCSDTCAAAIDRQDRAMQLILKKGLQNTRASAGYYYLCGAFCAAGAVGAYYYEPIPFLIWFIGACSGLFLATGLWYTLIARKS